MDWGVGLMANANSRITQHDENTGLGKKVLDWGQMTAGGAASVDGALRAVTGKGVGHWVQKISEGVQSAGKGASI